jgi:hypothetical protein
MAILTTTKAPPVTVYEVANDFHQWSSTLWRYIDPEVKEAFEGPASGVGSIYRWSGNEVGQGTMTITESKPGRQVVIKVKCIGPYSSSSTMILDMKGEGAGSAVTWSMKGERGLAVDMLPRVADSIEFSANLVDDLNKMRAIARHQIEISSWLERETDRVMKEPPARTKTSKSKSH